MMLVWMIGKTASRPLPVGPIRELNATTAPTSKATIAALNTKSYQGRVVVGMCTRQNGLTIKKQSEKTITLKMKAGKAVQATAPRAKTAESHAENAKDMLTQSERRCAVNT